MADPSGLRPQASGLFKLENTPVQKVTLDVYGSLRLHRRKRERHPFVRERWASEDHNGND